LSLENGGTLGTYTMRIGSDAGSRGTVSLTGAGSALSTSGLLEVGSTGLGSLYVTDGATLTTAKSTTIGNFEGATGAVSVDAGTWNTSDGIEVGRSGSASLSVLDGSRVILTSGLSADLSVAYGGTGHGVTDQVAVDNSSVTLFGGSFREGPTNNAIVNLQNAQAWSLFLV
jgi:fibronectin-binding autotransporter adhesin